MTDDSPINSQQNNQSHGAPLQSLRTYKSDAAESIETQHESVATIVLAEQKKRNKDGAATAYAGRRSSVRIAFSVGLIVGGILITWGIYYLIASYLEARNYHVSQIFINTVLFTETQKKITLASRSRTEIINTLQTEIRNATIAPGSAEGIYFIEKNVFTQGSNTTLKEQSISSKAFFTTAEIRMPAELERSLSNDFLVGIHKAQVTNPFLVLKIDSYPSAFKGMLDWEPTLFADLAALFDTKQVSFGQNPVFEDTVILNKDVRQLHDINNVPVLFYSFVDKTTIVITTSSDTLEELIGRLATARKVSS